MIESLLVRRAVCKNILRACNSFLKNFSITLIDNANSKNPKMREDYWRRTLKTYSPF